MKKFMILALALVATFMFVVPAMAVDVEFSGYYRVRGWYESQVELDDDNSESDAVFDHRFRIVPVFKITDNIKLTTKFEAQDNAKWGDNTDSSYGEDIGLERVYADINMDVVSLRIGRMAAGACGISYCNSEVDAERIKLILNDIDPFYLDFTYTKAVEDDYYNDTSDQDSDKYHLHGFYTSETMRAGLLFGFINDKTNSDDVAASTVYKWNSTGTAAVVDTDASVSASEGYDSQYWHINPYIEGKAGPISYLAEMEWKVGDYVDGVANDGVSPDDDRDYDAKRWIIEGAFDAGVATFGAGWAHSDGQDYDESDYTRADGGGGDWEPFLILTHTSANTDLGGFTNVNSYNNDEEFSDGTTTWTVGDLGLDIYYINASFVPMDKLTLGAALGFAYADTTDITQTAANADLDDELGWEFDLTAKYQVMDNLTYDVGFGYFDAGDFYDDIGTALGTGDLDESTWCVINTLMVTF